MRRFLAPPWHTSVNKSPKIHGKHTCIPPYNTPLSHLIAYYPRVRLRSRVPIARRGGREVTSMRAMAVATIAALIPLASVSARADDRIAADQATDRLSLQAFVEGARDYVEGITTLSETARLRDTFRAKGR